MDYSKDISNKIKGIAIILMVATHVLSLFTLNNDWGGLTIPLFNTGVSIEYVLGRSADICVLLFAYSTSCIGYTFAKHNLLSMVNELFKGKRWLMLLVTGVVGLSLQLVVFGYYGYGVIQVFTVIPIIIFLIELLSLSIPKWINKSLDILGHNSMNMWYIHYIFFAPYVICYIYSDKWIIFSRVAIVAVILGVIISLVIAIPFTYIDNKFIKHIKISPKQ